MRPVEGTITDRAMDAVLGTPSREVVEAIPTLDESLTLDAYQALAAQTAMYPRVYTEDQVRNMLTRVYLRESEWTRDEVEVFVDHDLDEFETPFNRLVYPILGLVGEAGELANKAKKIARDNQGQMDLAAVEDQEKELGDCGWYIAAIATELGTKLSTVAGKNVQKLFSRKARGVLGGSGDNR